jgi:hypothetical protein
VLGTVPAASFTSPAGDSLVWEFGDLGLFSDTAVTLELQTLLTTTLGTFVEIDAKVESNEPDVQPADNRALLQNVVVGSYDPNDKLVSREAVTIESPPSKAELAYTIRFQNTGTYPTSFVTLLDTLDADVFDLASLRWLGSSHPFEARMVDGNVLKIRFDTLALVPQAESEALSQGFVAFALTTREPLASPQVISNRAGIYFDYNEPVITPYARTVVDFTIGTEEAPAYSGMTLSPNPAGDWVTLVDGTHLHEVVDVSLFDNAGRLVLQQTITPSDNVVNLTSLPPSVYWIIARQNDRTMTGKFIKQ